MPTAEYIRVQNITMRRKKVFFFFKFFLRCYGSKVSKGCIPESNSLDKSQIFLNNTHKHVRFKKKTILLHICNDLVEQCEKCYYTITEVDNPGAF